MNQPGRLGHSLGHIPHQGGECFCSRYSRFLQYNLVPFGLVRRGIDSHGTRLETAPQPRPLKIIQPKSVSRCVTSWNKPSIQPSYPTYQVALISTSRITTTMKNTQRVNTNSLEIS